MGFSGLGNLPELPVVAPDEPYGAVLPLGSSAVLLVFHGPGPKQHLPPLKGSKKRNTLKNLSKAENLTQVWLQLPS